MSDLAINVEKINSLRLQAKNVLNLAIIEIEKPELTVKSSRGLGLDLFSWQLMTVVLVES